MFRAGHSVSLRGGDRRHPPQCRRLDWANGTGVDLHCGTATWEIPAGKVVGLVGPNGARKTTLLHLAVGLATPMYPGRSVVDHLHLGRALDPSWEDEVGSGRVARLQLDPGEEVGTLSGGQRAQLALPLAMAERPDLLVLDVPVAGLDPPPGGSVRRT